MSYQQKAIPEHLFTVRIEAPQPNKNAMHINILENGNFNLNGNLAKALQGQEILIRFTEDYKHLLISLGEGIRFPKSGSRKLIGCKDALNAVGIKLPAQYKVWKREESENWQGDLIVNPTKKPTCTKQDSKKC